MEKDLRSFIEQVKNKDNLINVDSEVDEKHGITSIISSIENEHKYPTIHFQHIKNSKIPIITNLLACRENVALSLEVDLAHLNPEIMLREKRRVAPKIVSLGPVKEQVLIGDEINLGQLPVLTHYGHDDGPCITSGLVLMKDPDTGLHNIACYRLKIKDKNTIVAIIEPSHQGNKIIENAKKKKIDVQVAVIIGHHPSFLLGAQIIDGICEDKLDGACSFYGEDLELTSCETIDLNIPSNSEIVIEGTIDPHKRELAGPFAESEGLYGEKKYCPIIRVSAISMRKDAIYHTTVPGFSEHLLWSGLSRSTYLYRNLKKEGFQISALDMPTFGFGNRVCVLSVKKDERRIKDIIEHVFSLAEKKDFLNYCFVVDNEVDIYNNFSVLRAITTRIRPNKDMFMLKPSEKNIKYGFDATLKSDPSMRVKIPSL